MSMVRTFRPGYRETRRCGEKTDRTNFLSYDLIRSGYIRGHEHGVLSYINSFSQKCIPPSMEIMARALGISRRWLTVIINRLVGKGLVLRTYLCYKKVCLRLASLSEQKRIVESGPQVGIFRALFRQAKLRVRRENKNEERVRFSNRAENVLTRLDEDYTSRNQRLNDSRRSALAFAEAFKRGSVSLDGLGQALVKPINKEPDSDTRRTLQFDLRSMSEFGFENEETKRKRITDQKYKLLSQIEAFRNGELKLNSPK